MARDAILSIDYTREPGYPKERITRTEVEVVDMMQCAWADRITLTKELLGHTFAGILFSAHKYDFGDDKIGNIYCKDVSIIPRITINSSGEYITALLEVVYGNLGYSEPEQGVVYVTESLEPASEFLTLSHEGLYWDVAQAEPLGDTDAPAVILRMIDWVYTLHFMSHIPSWVWSHPGTVNNATVYSRELNKYFPAYTLLCGNPTLSREVTSEGTTAWTITARFTYRYETWNKFPRTTEAGALDFYPIYDKNGNAKAFYTATNFGSIVI